MPRVAAMVAARPGEHSGVSLVDGAAFDLLVWAGRAPVLVALAGLLLDRVVPRSRPRSRLIGALAELVRRLNRAGRDEGRLRRRALALWLVVVAAGGLFGILAVRAIAARPLFEPALALAALVWAIAYRPAQAAAGRAVPGLQRLAATRPPAAVRGVAATARLRLARRFADGSVAVVLAWLVFGLPGLAVVKASQLLAEAAEADARSPFCQVILTCHGALTLVPCWLAALLITGDRRLPPLALPPRALLHSLDSGAPGDPVGSLIRVRRAVERGWWLWLALLVLAGGIAAGLR